MSRCRSFLPDLMSVRAVMVRAAMEKKKVIVEWALDFSLRRSTSGVAFTVSLLVEDCQNPRDPSQPASKKKEKKYFQKAIDESKALHAHRWQTKEGTYRIKKHVLPDVRDGRDVCEDAGASTSDVVHYSHGSLTLSTIPMGH